MLIVRSMYELAKIFELKNIRTNTHKGKLHDVLMKQEEVQQTWNGTWKSWYASTNGTLTNVQCSDGSDSLEQQTTIKSKRKSHHQHNKKKGNDLEIGQIPVRSSLS